MNKIKIRTINNSDISSVIEIYNFHIKNSLGNFEEKITSKRQFIKVVNNILSNKLPFIVVEANKKIIGFAFLNQYRNKSGYRFTYENSIYIDPLFMNKGIGTKLLKNLIKISKKN